jgi:hypothetical protein
MGLRKSIAQTDGLHRTAEFMLYEHHQEWTPMETLVIPELKSLVSPDLENDRFPIDPEDCEVSLEAQIGVAGQPGGDLFQFSAVTPRALLRAHLDRRWGRGLLILDRFSWRSCEDAIHNLLSHCSRPTWAEVAASLNKELQWEFENYRP